MYGWLALHEMQIDKTTTFIINTIDLNNTNVLIWLEQIEGAKGKNVIIVKKGKKTKC